MRGLAPLSAARTPFGAGWRVMSFVGSPCALRIASWPIRENAPHTGQDALQLRIRRLVRSAERCDLRSERQALSVQHKLEPICDTEFFL